MVSKLTDADLLILQHVARYRLTTARILTAATLDRGATEADSERALASLVGQGYLCRGNLVPGLAEPEAYYHLSAKAAKQLGHDAVFAQPPRLEARIEHFAIATFCCGSEGRTLFTKTEFTSKFRSLWYPGQPLRYYIEPSKTGPAKLAYLKVDKDGPGRWTRLIDKCGRFLDQRTAVQAAAQEHQAHKRTFRKLVEDGRFQFTILTALEDKKRAIEVELERRRAANGSAPPIAVHVVPQLWSMMFPDLAMT